MPDADRLREAADELDDWQSFGWTQAGIEAVLPRMALLLRAVADRMDQQYVIRGFDCVHCRNVRDCQISDYCAEHAAALALADSIGKARLGYE